MIRHAEQAVRVWRQMNADYVRALIGDDIKGSPVLMSEPPTVPPLGHARDEEVQGRRRNAPAPVPFLISVPLACWLNIKWIT